MRNKLKKVFENAVWWSGVVMVGLILGISLQFVRAWTEPIEAPPGGNVGAPINTGILPQNKSGMLGVGGLITSLLNLGDPGNQPQAGYVLQVKRVTLHDPVVDPGGTDTAQVAWGPGGGGWYVPSEVKLTNESHTGKFSSGPSGPYSLDGYQKMYEWIQDHDCRGFHVCDLTELTRYYQLHSVSSLSEVLKGWYNGGFFESGHTTDCNGWEIGTPMEVHGSQWKGWDLTNGPGAHNCEQPIPVMCCK